jgi:hypothetical protein
VPVKPIRFFVMAFLVSVPCGCFGMVGGACAFYAAARSVKEAPHRKRGIRVEYDYGVVAGSTLDYVFKLTDDIVPTESLLHKELEFSSGTRHAIRLAVSIDRADSERISCLFGYTRQNRESTMDGTTLPSREDAVYVGGEYTKNRPESRTFYFTRFVGGMGAIEIGQSLATPPYPSYDGPDLSTRYAQLAGGVGYRPAPWAEVRAGVALDMIALPHPGGHMNGTIAGGDSADKTMGAFIGISIDHHF